MSEQTKKEEQEAAEEETKRKYLKVLYAMLPYEGTNSLEFISERSGLPQNDVLQILTKLHDQGQVKISGDIYLLNPEIERNISILRSIEKDIEESKRFDKYLSNPDYEANLEQGIKFDINKVENEAGEFQFVRDISPHVKVFCFQKRLYHVWREGPKTNEVFLIENKIPEENVKIVSTNEFLITVTNLLREISRNRNQNNLAQLHRYVLSICYGDANTLGWDHARFYDLDGQGNIINEIMTQLLEKSIDQYLSDLAKQEGIEVHSYQLNFQERDIFPYYYDGLEEQKRRENIWKDSNSKIVLRHGTYSHILPNFVQMRGLAARNYYQSFGINKYYGGEGQGKGSYTPNDVSFWYSEDEEAMVSGGYGSQRAYDYPIMIGISEESANKLKLRLGSMQTEATVNNFVPSELITHMFVPSFKINEVKQLFEQNGIINIQVLPLRQK